jgi:hypothetical protein
MEMKLNWFSWFRRQPDFASMGRQLLAEGYRECQDVSRVRDGVKSRRRRVEKLLRKMGSNNSVHQFRTMSFSMVSRGPEQKNFNLLVKGFRGAIKTTAWNEISYHRIKFLVESLKEYGNETRVALLDHAYELEELLAVLQKADREYLELGRHEKSVVAQIAIIDVGAAGVLLGRYRKKHATRRRRMIDLRRILDARENVLAALESGSAGGSGHHSPNSRRKKLTTDITRCKADSRISFGDVAALHARLDEEIAAIAPRNLASLSRKARSLLLESQGSG